MSKLVSVVALALAIAVSAMAQGTRENAIIVLDASGSMWGRIDDTPKILIAREVLAGLLQDWPADRQLGIVAYGHRREGDCQDIEQILPVGTLDVASTVDLINGITPRGRTPLTEAVRQAAEQLSFEDAPATVILLSDGLETCQADPCALGQELARRGVAFTAHVVGFDVAEADYPQLACLAEATGGIFLPAANADELKAALTTVTEVAEPALTAEVVLEAVDDATGAPLPGVTWSVLNLTTEDSTRIVAPGATHRVTLDPGTYRIEASLGDRAGSAEITVEPRTAASHQVRLAGAEVAANVSAPSEIPAGSTFTVEWSGPAESQDYITIVEAGAPEDSYNHYARVRADSASVEIRAPDALGAYEVRYVLNQGRRVLASQPVTLTPVSASVGAPAEIAAGSRFTVEWSGPVNQQDYITIVEAGAPEGSYTSYARVRADRAPVQITAPDALGAYEIRYVINQSGRTLASQPVTLTAIGASLTVPAEIAAGSRITIEWTGPANPQDYITIVEAGAPEGSYTNYVRVRADGAPVQLTAPDGLGSYEVRYVINQSGRTLVSQPVTLVAVGAAVAVPDEIPAGSRVTVDWTGPANPQDYITIVEAGAPEGSYTSYARVRADGDPVQITAPDALGAYEVRYVINQSGRTLASRPVTLTAVSAHLEVTDAIVPGGQFMVDWTGPVNPQDYITIVPAGAPEGTYTHYQRVLEDGRAVRINAPDEPGDYEVRYVINQSGRTLASLPVQVGGQDVHLAVQGEVTAGSVITVEWTGPGRYEDVIEVVPAGSADTVQGARQSRASQGSPLQLFAPAQAGEYELRYRATDSGEVLGRLPITVR